MTVTTDTQAQSIAAFEHSCELRARDTMSLLDSVKYGLLSRKDKHALCQGKRRPLCPNSGRGRDII
jgi:hypothetical protein